MIQTLTKMLKFIFSDFFLRRNDFLQLLLDSETDSDKNDKTKSKEGKYIFKFSLDIVFS